MQIWHQDMVTQLADVLLSSLVQSVGLADDFYEIISSEQQTELQNLYGAGKSACIVGLLREAGKKVGIELPGMTIKQQQGSRIPTASLLELLRSDDGA